MTAGAAAWSRGPDAAVPTLSCVVTEAVAPERLDRVALALFGVLASPSQVRKLARKGSVRLDGEVVGPMTTARPGQVLAITLPEPRPVAPVAVEVPIVHLDDWLAVVDKPAGLVTSGWQRRTLAHALVSLLPPSPLPDALVQPHPVHRLDARTRGLVLVARSFGADAALSVAFAERRVRKRYLALLRGALPGEGVVEREVEGQPARSRWRSLRVDPAPLTGHVTTVELWPETGRKHQLRRHMAALGHPVLGDGRYTEEGPVLRSQGLMLAAVGLAFPHPGTGQVVTVELEEPEKFRTFRERAIRRASRGGAGS